MKNLIITLLFLIPLVNASAQTRIPLEESNGVYYIPCKVNGLDMNFIFDSGASDVILSLTEALYMLKNDYLSEESIIGKENYQIANGDIEEGTKIILNSINIGGNVIENVEASIVHNLDAPLLLGQSALSRLGKYTFDYSTNTLIIGSGIITPYGHLNLGNLLEMMPEREAADQELASLRDEGLAKGEEMIKVLDEKVKAYQQARQSGTLNQIQSSEMEAELQAMNQEIVQYEKQLQAELAQKRQELLSPILMKVDSAVKSVAAENKYLMIFDTSVMNGVLFAQDSEDVLPLVKAKLGVE